MKNSHTQANEPSRREFLSTASCASVATLAGVTSLLLGGSAVSASAGAGPTDPPKRSGPARLKLGLAAYSYRDYLQSKREPHMTLNEFVDRAAKMPLDAVELTEYYFPKPITEEYIANLKRQCFLQGLDISGSPMGTTLTHPAGEKRDKEIARVHDWIDKAVLLGAPTVRIFAGDAQKGQSLADAEKCVIETVEICCDYASKRGMLLAMENHHGVTAESDGILAIVKGVKSDWFGINLDFGNFWTADPYADLAKCAPFAFVTHVKTEIKPNGGAKIPSDLKRVVKILKDAGYRGYATLEYEAAEEPLVAVPRILDELHGLL